MKRKIKWKRWLIAAAVAVLVIAGALYTWYLNALFGLFKQGLISPFVMN